MTVWLCRAGLRAEYEKKFIDQEKIFLTGTVGMDLTGKTDMQELMAAISRSHPTEPDGSVVTMSTQARAFATKVKAGDWVVVPSGGPERLLNIGEIVGGYEYDGAKREFRHIHKVDWKYGLWERSSFNEKTQRSFDAFDAFMMFFKLSQDKHIKDVVLKGRPYAPIIPGGMRKQEPEPIPGPIPEPVKEPEPAPEPKKSINKPEPEIEDDTETVYVEAEEYDDEWRCPCGRTNVACYKYNRWYYDILKARRCFRR